MAVKCRRDKAQNRHHCVAHDPRPAPRVQGQPGLRRRRGASRRPPAAGAGARSGHGRPGSGGPGRAVAHRRRRRVALVLRGRTRLGGVRGEHRPRPMGVGPGGRGSAGWPADPRGVPGRPDSERGRRRHPDPAPPRRERRASRPAGSSGERRGSPGRHRPSQPAGHRGRRRPLGGQLHHQALALVGTGLRAVAWGPDGIIEAVESAEHQPILAVQWHPELMLDHPRHQQLFGWLAEASSSYSSSTTATNESLQTRSA